MFTPLARAGVAAASPRRSEGSDEGGGHIMLSYEWSVQPVIKRIRDSLVRRGYRVWLDIDQMRGSTMDVSQPCHLRCQQACGALAAGGRGLLPLACALLPRPPPHCILLVPAALAPSSRTCACADACSDSEHVRM